MFSVYHTDVIESNKPINDLSYMGEYYYKDIEGISGATILGDGTVALILDIQKLVQIAEKEEMRM